MADRRARWWFGDYRRYCIYVGALLYIKSQKTHTVLPPMLNTETGQMVLVPGGPFQQGNEKKPP